MRIRMKTLLAGPDEVIQPGRVVDLPEAQAQALVDGGYAEAVGSAPAEAAIATSAPAEPARVDVEDQDVPAEEAMPPEPPSDEAKIYVDDPTAQPPEKPAARRGRGRK